MLNEICPKKFHLKLVLTIRLQPSPKPIPSISVRTFSGDFRANTTLLSGVVNKMPSGGQVLYDSAISQDKAHFGAFCVPLSTQQTPRGFAALLPAVGWKEESCGSAWLD